MDGFDKIDLCLVNYGREYRHIAILIFSPSDLEFHIIEIIAINIHTKLDEEWRFDERCVVSV